MAQIIPFMRPHTAFDPETAALLAAAYEKAIEKLDGGGCQKAASEIIAKRIVTLAAKGERDPERLCKAALAGLGNR